MQDGLNGIYTNPLARSGPASPSSSRGWRSNLTGEAPWRPPSASAEVTGHRRAGDGSGPPAAGTRARRDTARRGRVLSVDDLRVTIPGARRPIHAVRGVTFAVRGKARPSASSASPARASR
ncbi:hypothetical protein GCM10020220_077310 [Nonomuraea rubra]